MAKEFHFVVIVLWVVFGLSRGFSQDQDSVFETASKMDGDAGTIALCAYIDSLTVTRSVDPMPLALKTIDLAKSTGSKRGQGRAYFVLAQLHRFQTLDYKEARRYYNLAIPLLKESNDHLFYGRAIIGHAAMLQLEEGSLKARPLYVDAIHILMSGDEVAKAYAYESRGHQFYNDRQPDSMMYYLDKALVILSKHNKILRAAYLLNIMSEEFLLFNDVTSAQKTVHLLDSLVDRYPIDYFKYLAEKARANVLIHQHKYREALSSLTQAVVYEDSFAFSSPVTTKLYQNLAYCHFQLKEWNLAYVTIRKSLSYSQKFNDVMSETVTYRLLSDLHEAQGRLDSALHYRKRFASMNEKLFADGQIRLKDLEATFIADQKVRENEMLARSLTFRNWIIVSVLLVLALSVLLTAALFRSRKRLRKLNLRLEDLNSEILAQNEEMVSQNEQINLQNDQLIEQSRRVAEQSRLLEISYTNLKKLEEAGKKITSSLSSVEIIDNCYSFIAHVINIDTFGIAVYDEENKRLVFPRIITRKGPMHSIVKPLTDQRSIVVQSFFERREVLRQRSATAEDLAGHAAVLENGKSSIACPLLINDKAIGVMFASQENDQPFNGLQVDLIKNIANYSAIAIENAKNYQQVLDDQEKLAEAGALKDKLISIVSHDLKGPMNSLKGFLMLLASKNLTEEETNSLIQGLEKHFNHTLELIDSVLLWTKSQMSGLRVFPRYFDIVEPGSSVAALLKEQANAKNISIINELPSVTAFADMTMVELILRNLVSNAVKFTKPGGWVKMNASTAGDRVTITVSDNGIGMPEGLVKILFQGEQRFSSVGTANEKGTGLGLYLCKEFAERLNGKITVVSSLGQGSTFYLDLPMQPHA